MKNEYYLSNDGKTAYIKLTQGQIAIVDAEDLEKIGEYRWAAVWIAKSKKYYVRAYVSATKGTIGLQRLLTNAKKDDVVDHINGDSLDNRKSNLRLCTKRQNAQNMPPQSRNELGIRGVYRKDIRYVARIYIDGRNAYLGTFNTIEEAIEARLKAEKEIHGEFSRKTDMVVHERVQYVERDCKPEEYYMEGYGTVYRVPLTKGQFAIIDIEDYDIVSKHTWHASFAKCSNSYYAKTNIKIEGKQTSKPMHKLIMNAPKGFVIDHINGNTLDNRRCNLRVCTQAENSRNRKTSENTISGYKGVIKKKNRWQARIMYNSEHINLGFFSTPQEAHEAYCAAALKYFGEFARLA